MTVYPRLHSELTTPDETTSNTEADYRDYSAIAAKLRGGMPFVTVGSDAGCDYVTDGTADDVQVNLAISEATDGDGIKVLPGTYDITDPIINAGKTKIRFQGAGKYSTIFKLANTIDTHVFSLSNAAWVLTDFGVDGNSSHQSAVVAGIYGSGMSNTLIQNVDVQNVKHNCIQLIGSSDNSKTVNCSVKNAQNGITFIDSRYCQIISCKAETIGVTNSDDDFLIIASTAGTGLADHGKIVDCVAVNTIANGASIYNCDYGDVSALKYYNLTGIGADDATSGVDLHATKHSIVQGCTIQGSLATYALGVDVSATSENCAIVNNIIKGLGSSGISEGVGSSYLTISGNKLYDTCQTYQWGGNGIDLTGTLYSVISNNTIVNTGVNALNTPSAIKENTGCNYNLAAHNIIVNPIGTAIVRVGANSIFKDNIGAANSP